MKLTRKAKIRIRKGVTIARGVFLGLFLVFMGLTICSADSESLVFPIVCFVISMVCFGVCYLLDELLWQTS